MITEHLPRRRALGTLVSGQQNGNEAEGNTLINNGEAFPEPQL